MNQDPNVATEAMRAGASAYLLKSSASSELFHAIEEALNGRSYVTKQIARGMQEIFIRDPRPKERVLSYRQREVVQLLAEGKSMKAAAEVLNLKPRTVAFHKYRVMEEMRFKNTAELVQFAVKTNIVTPLMGTRFSGMLITSDCLQARAPDLRRVAEIATLNIDDPSDLSFVRNVVLPVTFASSVRLPSPDNISCWVATSVYSSL